MIYSVRHTTTFRYEPAVRESVMEVRLQPRSEGEQRCLSFTLDVDPAANIMQYRDFAGNTVHHFDIAGTHKVVKVTAQSAVDVQPVPSPRAADSGDWSDLDALVAGNDHWEMLLPSHFAQSSAPLEQLAKELRWTRRDNPLVLLTELNEAIYKMFAYVPNSTKVDSPIEEALHNPAGRVPGLCPYHDRARPAVTDSVPLCQRLYVSPRRIREGPLGGRRLACLG